MPLGIAYYFKLIDRRFGIGDSTFEQCPELFREALDIFLVKPAIVVVKLRAAHLPASHPRKPQTKRLGSGGLGLDRVCDLARGVLLGLVIELEARWKVRRVGFSEGV